MEDVGSVDRTELVSSIVAENAVLRVKIKHEYDLACTFAADINKIESDIETCQRELKRCEEIYELKTADYTRLKEYLENIRVSKDRVQNSIENLQRQHEMMLIEEETCAKERDTVRANYEAMIRNQIDINNMYPIVIEKNKVQNELDSCRIQLAVLQKKREDMVATKRKLNEITNLRFQQAVVVFAKRFVEARNCYKKNLQLDNLLKEKRKKLEELKEAKRKQNAENESAGKFNLSKTIRTLLPPAWKTPFPVARNIATMALPKSGDTLKYLHEMNALNRSHSSLTASLTSSFLLSQSLPANLENPFVQFRNSSRSQSTEIADKPVRSIVSDAYGDVDSGPGSQEVNDDAVDKSDAVDGPENGAGDGELDRAMLVKSAVSEILPEKLAAIEISGAAENDANAVAGEVSSQPDDDGPKSPPCSTVENGSETVVRSCASPSKSRIPILVAKDSPRVVASPKNVPPPESSSIGTAKEAANTPKRANAESPKRAQKMAKFDHASKPDTSRHAACKIRSELTKIGANSPLKKFVQDKRIVAARSNAKMGATNDEPKSAFQLGTKTMRELRMNPRKQSTSKEPRPKVKNVVEERHRNESATPVKAKKTVETTDSTIKFRRIPLSEMIKTPDGKKRSANVDVRKNVNLDEKSAAETSKTTGEQRIEDDDDAQSSDKNEVNSPTCSKYFATKQTDGDDEGEKSGAGGASYNESDNNDNGSFYRGLNETYTLRSPESDNSSAPSFPSTNTENTFAENTFPFGSSVADIFGAEADEVDQRDNFSFNFKSQPDNRPFKLF